MRVPSWSDRVNSRLETHHPSESCRQGQFIHAEAPSLSHTTLIAQRQRALKTGEGPSRQSKGRKSRQRIAGQNKKEEEEAEVCVCVFQQKSSPKKDKEVVQEECLAHQPGDAAQKLAARFRREGLIYANKRTSTHSRNLDKACKQTHTHTIKHTGEAM